MPSHSILLLPGWGNSGALHWQSLWEREHGYTRVEQHEWDTPKRGDWIVQLEEHVLRAKQKCLLVSHSLGCQLIAAWSATSKNTQLIDGALMVAPPDLDQTDCPQELVPWRPMVLQRLKFPAVVVASSNDPYCEFSRAAQFAQHWGASFMSIGDKGHINSDSGLGHWPEGHALLRQLST